MKRRLTRERRLLGFVLVLALLPGVTGNLLADPVRCNHACCEDGFCHRAVMPGQGDDGHGMPKRHAGHAGHSGHPGHVAAPPASSRLIVRAVHNHEQACREICAVLQAGVNIFSSPRTQESRSVFVPHWDPRSREQSIVPEPFFFRNTSPRGPPRPHSHI